MNKGERESEGIRPVYGLGWQIQTLRSEVACVLSFRFVTSSFSYKCSCCSFFLSLIRTKREREREKERERERVWYRTHNSLKWFNAQNTLAHNSNNMRERERERERESAFCHPVCQIVFLSLSHVLFELWPGSFSSSLFGSLLNVHFQLCLNAKPVHL